MRDTNEAVENMDNIIRLPVPERNTDPAPEPERFSVQVGFGPESREFEFSRGDTVRSILNNGLIKELIGFRGGEGIVVNGRTVDPNYFLNPGDHVDFVKEAGTKA